MSLPQAPRHPPCGPAALPRHAHCPPFCPHRGLPWAQPEPVAYEALSTRGQMHGCTRDVGGWQEDGRRVTAQGPGAHLHRASVPQAAPIPSPAPCGARAESPWPC